MEKRVFLSQNLGLDESVAVLLKLVEWFKGSIYCKLCGNRVQKTTVKMRAESLISYLHLNVLG